MTKTIKFDINLVPRKSVLFQLRIKPLTLSYFKNKNMKFIIYCKTWFNATEHDLWMFLSGRHDNAKKKGENWCNRDQKCSYRAGKNMKKQYFWSRCLPLLEPTVLVSHLLLGSLWTPTWVDHPICNTYKSSMKYEPINVNSSTIDLPKKGN